jgi:hypothetical protein
VAKFQTNKRRSKMAKTPEDFGENLYVVRVPKSIAESGEVVVYADSFEITDTGQLLFSYKDEEGDEFFTFCLNSTEWKAVYQGSTKYETPLCVKRWSGVAGVKVVEIIKPVTAKEVVVEKSVPKEDKEELTDEELEEATKPVEE